MVHNTTYGANKNHSEKNETSLENTSSDTSSSSGSHIFISDDEESQSQNGDNTFIPEYSMITDEGYELNVPIHSENYTFNSNFSVTGASLSENPIYARYPEFSIPRNHYQHQLMNENHVMPYHNINEELIPFQPDVYYYLPPFQMNPVLLPVYHYNILQPVTVPIYPLSGFIQHFQVATPAPFMMLESLNATHNDLAYIHGPDYPLTNTVDIDPESEERESNNMVPTMAVICAIFMMICGIIRAKRLVRG